MAYATATETLDIIALKDLLAGERTCMMTQTLPRGEITSRPMTLLKLEDNGVLWFMTDIGNIDRADWSVNVAFSNEGQNTYVSIFGMAQAGQGRDQIHELWSVTCKPWFPDGPDSPDIALIKVTPIHIEYWDGPSNAITRTASLFASVVAGKPVGMGVHGVIQP